ncbi:hypothetical protein [Streptomyces sp. CBMA29]|uniref:hypothetical protein n=1 Tax=Streptomyces sp. CBMA29 TaxID=1896314 RepID=UPI002948C43E|nr:hypothetical protein [Streptomyces sp. CBMA29]
MESAESSVNMPDDGLVRRVKALACTAPIQALEAVKGSLGRVDARPYQMVELALHTIDQVAMAMDFNTGAEHDKVTEQVSHFAAVQAPKQSEEQHREVAEWVLHKLINIGTIDRGFTWQYGRVDGEGTYGLYDFEFKLLVEHSAPDGRVFLRVTDEAINVLVGALDTDVESAQVAAEHKLEYLIKRRRLEDAKLAAEQARYRTVQYGEYLRQYLEATRRDVRTVDWEREVPELLDEALEHIEERCLHENAILSSITAHRDETRDPRRKQQAAELVDIVRDCIRRHMQLQSRLQGAGALFRAEQDRQQFSGPPQRAAIDVFNQVLIPLLGLGVGAAMGPVTDFFRCGLPPVPPAVTSLDTLVGRLLITRSDRSVYAGDVPTPVLRDGAEPPRFSEEEQRRAGELLDFPADESHMLSAVLAEARTYGPAVERLVLHDAVHAFSPALSEAVLRGDPSLLIAVRSPGHIDSPALGGDDFLLSRVRIEDVAGDDGFRNEEFGE